MVINHECYVSLEVAKLLKQVEFDWPCIMYYENEEGILHGPLVQQYKMVVTNFNVAPVYMVQYSAPTLEVAQRWLREEKEICIAVFPVENRFTFVIVELGEKFNPDDYILEYYTYEEALESGIKRALEFILEKED